MKFESKHFDRIRIQPRHAQKPRVEIKLCEWEGCEKPGTHRAPKRNRPQGEYHSFCLAHVREYNQQFDFFAEKDGEPVNRDSRPDGTERPTWAFGANRHARGTTKPNQNKTRDFANRRFADPLNIFARSDRVNAKGQKPERKRTLVEADRQALEILGFDDRPERDNLKRAYKDLVKKNHPDANGGDRASEDRLRSVIAAYTHLKAKGFV
jgi:hypothetical protein